VENHTALHLMRDTLRSGPKTATLNSGSVNHFDGYTVQ
jgi:hypothetical protein